MHSEAAYVKFQNKPYKIVPDPNNMDDIKFIKLGIHTVQAEVNGHLMDKNLVEIAAPNLVSFPDPALPTEEGLVLFEQFLGLFSRARSADLDMLPSNTTSRARGLVIRW